MQELLYRFNPYWVFQCAATSILDTISSPVLLVSIPIGFSNALRLILTGLTAVNTKAFQSLLGFPMRCDAFLMRHLSIMRQVSIPIGFSNALRRTHKPHRHIIINVSIPIGFSNALRHVPFTVCIFRGCVSIPIGFSNALRLDTDPFQCHWSSFNPYWVFQCAATRCRRR